MADIYGAGMEDKMGNLIRQLAETEIRERQLREKIEALVGVLENINKDLVRLFKLYPDAGYFIARMTEENNRVLSQI